MTQPLLTPELLETGKSADVLKAMSTDVKRALPESRMRDVEFFAVQSAPLADKKRVPLFIVAVKHDEFVTWQASLKPLKPVWGLCNIAKQEDGSTQVEIKEVHGDRKVATQVATAALKARYKVVDAVRAADAAAKTKDPRRGVLPNAMRAKLKATEDAPRAQAFQHISVQFESIRTAFVEGDRADYEKFARELRGMATKLRESSSDPKTARLLDELDDGVKELAKQAADGDVSQPIATIQRALARIADEAGLPFQERTLQQVRRASWGESDRVEARDRATASLGKIQKLFTGLRGLDGKSKRTQARKKAVAAIRGELKIINAAMTDDLRKATTGELGDFSHHLSRLLDGDNVRLRPKGSSPSDDFQPKDYDNAADYFKKQQDRIADIQRAITEEFKDVAGIVA